MYVTVLDAVYVLGGSWLEKVSLKLSHVWIFIFAVLNCLSRHYNSLKPKLKKTF